jgi:cytochrome c-type biogenesis protein CcmF
VFIVIAFLSLMNAYVTSDFSVFNVASNSHSAKPMLYKIAGVWGNHEGSLVLWVLILATFGGAIVLFGGNLPPALRARVLSVQALIAVGFLSFSLFTSNPFERVFPAPLDGNGLNPLLQDPGLAFHPPFLYLGYVGFSVAFAFAIAALIEGRVDAAWARWVRPWTLIAWSFLTIGIALGSWWAYYELGWGGWWYWDPVENASFMPWLAGTALLHSAIVCEKRDALKAWTVLLAIVAFSLSLLGTFLVRSGVLTSVHAFATDPARGVFILGFLIFVVGGSLTLFAVRAPLLKAGGLFAPVSREGGIVLNNLLFSAAAATVLLGTLYPLFIDALGAGKVSVGPPYFNTVFIPLMAPLIVLAGIAPMLAWKRADLTGVIARIKIVAAVTVLVLLWSVYRAWGNAVFGAFGIGLSAWLASSVLFDWVVRIRLFRVSALDSLQRAIRIPRAAYGMSLAHFGVALLVAGVTASSAWRTEAIQVMRQGETISVAGFEFLFHGVVRAEGPNYTADRGHFTVTRAGGLVAELWPENRFYPVQQQPTTEAAIHTTWLSDLYVVVGDPDGQGGWSTRVYYNPLVPWIWLGAMVMALGGAVSLSDRRHRVGAPNRRRRRLMAGEPAAEVAR